MYTNTSSVIYRKLDYLEYAINNGFLLDETVFIKSAARNDFTALKFINEKFQDKLVISKYIIMNEYKWNESLFELIILNNDLDTLEIYKKYGCPV
jgi:hypothetical protein